MEDRLIIKPKAALSIVEGDEAMPALSYLVEAAISLGVSFAVVAVQEEKLVHVNYMDTAPKIVRTFESDADPAVRAMIVTLAAELQAHAAKVAEAMNQKAAEKAEKTTPIEVPEDGFKIGVRGKEVVIVFAQPTKVLAFDADDATEFGQVVLKAAKHARTV